MKTQILLVAILLSFTFAKAQNQEGPADLEYAPFQFSFITPPLSTNGVDFYKTVNDFSVNTFLGVSAGTEGFEAAGFSNINLYYTDGFQMAGFANVVGLLHRDYYNSGGMQMAGFANLNANTFNGVQMAGFANVNNRFSGVQMAGFANVNNRAVETVQMAGFANLNYEAVSAVQLAGFANVDMNGKGQVQLAGFANVAKNVEGVQAAGFANLAGNVKGIQLSGFINVCDSIDGIPISFISYVRKNGYRSVELSTTDWAPVQVSYKMGVDKLYNIYSLSKAYHYNNMYMLGFGFGHTITLGEKSKVQLELVNHSELKYDRYYLYSSLTNNLLQFKPVFKREIAKQVCVNVGPSLSLAYTWNNGYYRNSTNQYPEVVYPFWQNESRATSKLSDRLWLGFTAGISFR